MPTETHAWDRQENEPPLAYTRFLVYRNLGPARSVAQAAAVADTILTDAQAAMTGRRKAKREVKKPNGWHEHCTDWNWVARAEAWDAWRLIDAGNRVQAALTELMTELTRLGIRKAQAGAWKVALEIFGKLASHAPNQVIAAAPVEGSAGPAPAPSGPTLRIAQPERTG